VIGGNSLRSELLATTCTPPGASSLMAGCRCRPGLWPRDGSRRARPSRTSRELRPFRRWRCAGSGPRSPGPIRGPARVGPVEISGVIAPDPLIGPDRRRPRRLSGAWTGSVAVDGHRWASDPPWTGADRGADDHSLGNYSHRNRVSCTVAGGFADSSLMRPRIPGRRTRKVFCEPAGQGLICHPFLFFL
jgi:hypothetical protein